MKLIAAALCFAFLASSATCRPLEGRQLLQSAQDFINQYNSGASQDVLQTTYNNLLKTNPDQAKTALTTTIQNTQNGGGNGGVLSSIAANSLNSPGVPTTVAANIISQATGTPNTGNTAAGANANVVLDAIAKNGGNVNVNITADAAAQATAENAIVQASVAAIAAVKGGQSASASADIAAVAVGKAAATAFAGIITQIKVGGNGAVKSQVDVAAAAYAKAFAAVIINVFVQASNDNAKATVQAQLEAFNQVFVSAYAAISQTAFQNGPGTIDAVQTSYSSSVKAPLAAVFVKVLATVSTSPPTTG